MERSSTSNNRVDTRITIKGTTGSQFSKIELTAANQGGNTPGIADIQIAEAASGGRVCWTFVVPKRLKFFVAVPGMKVVEAA